MACPYSWRVPTYAFGTLNLKADTGLKPPKDEPAPFDLGLAGTETTFYVPPWLATVRSLPLLMLVVLALWRPNRRWRTLAWGLAAIVVYCAIGLEVADNGMLTTLRNLAGFDEFRFVTIPLYMAGVVSGVALEEAIQLIVPALMSALLAAPIYRHYSRGRRLLWMVGCYLAGGLLWGILDSPYPDVVLAVRLGWFGVFSLWLTLPAALAISAFKRRRGWKRFMLLALCVAPLFGFAALGVEEAQPGRAYAYAAIIALCSLGVSLWLGGKASVSRAWLILALQAFGIGMASSLALLLGERLWTGAAFGIMLGLLLFAGRVVADRFARRPEVQAGQFVQ